MKELTIKRTIQVQQYEPVTFEATFEKASYKSIQENIEFFIDRAFEEFAMIIKRAGLNDKIQWVKPEGKNLGEDIVPWDLADKIDAALEENDIDPYCLKYKCDLTRKNGHQCIRPEGPDDV